MIYKKIGLILLTLVFILSISAVSANDGNFTDEVIASEEGDEPPSVISNASCGEALLSNENTSALNTHNQNGSYVLSGSDVSMYYKDGSNYKLSLSKGNLPVENASVVIKIGSNIYTKNTDKNGLINLPITLTSGNYLISASHGDVVITNKLKVMPVVIAKDLTKHYKGSEKFTAKFLNAQGKALKNTYVKFKINGITYKVKTNKKGIASLAINLKAGKYLIYSIHPNAYKLKNNIEVLSSIYTKDLNKHYKSSLKFTAKFFTKNGKVLAKKYIKFRCHGSTYTVKTNENGVASLKVISKPSTFKITSINPVTSEKHTNTIKVLPTLSAKSMRVFTGKTSTFKVKLYKNEKLAKKAKVYVYIDGAKKTLKTDSNGVASVNFKLSKGTYNFKSVDPYTGYTLNKKVTVKLSSLKATDMYARENQRSSFQVKLLKQNGNIAKDTKLSVSIDGVEKTVKTNSRGIATVDFKLKKGSHTVISKDLNTGYTLKNKITVLDSNQGKHYNKYGVSEDGKTILVIGRASAAGEEGKYGYTFYKAEFLRTCPYCGGHDLYWSIFWAGDETSDKGIFPATGHRESGSAEGMIFCKDCDCDWSVFGHNHDGSGRDLTLIGKIQKSSKEEAYLLLSGNYIAP